MSEDRQWIRDVVSNVSYRDWKFNISEPVAGVLILDLRFQAQDPYAGGFGWQTTRRWLLEPKDESELLRTCWLAVMTAEEHEAREQFTYLGKRIFNPHKNHVPQEKTA